MNFPTSVVGVNEQDELQRLRRENTLLKELLNRNNITWEQATLPISAPSASESVLAPTHFTTDDKIALFRRLFRGRVDVYPQRWASSKGTSGYSPACGNEWKPGICHKPRVKCGDCNQRQLLPVTDQVIFDHLAGKMTIGVYPLLSDDSCYFLAADFDEADWREDAKAFMESCQEISIPAALEISRSGNGAHAWIFFTESVPSREARQLGGALISHTCDRTRQLSLTSYDRLFPNQDTMPKGGFGNLIALPLQKLPRELCCSVFVDEHLQPYPDQWAFLASVHPMSRQELEDAILRASGGVIPWMWPSSAKTRISSPGNDHRRYPPELSALCLNH